MGLDIQLTTPPAGKLISARAGVVLAPGRGPGAGKKISATLADPRINVRYDPDPGDLSTKIVFIQVMRELLEGTPSLPSVLDKGFAFQDKDTDPATFLHVDFVSGEKDPYYNGDDAGLDIGKQGNGPAKVAATMHDTPNYNDSTFPAGKAKMKYEFRTAAFSAAGPDKGKYYGFVDWTYTKEKGKTAKLALPVPASSQDPGGDFKAAVELWAKNHGFSLPKFTPPPPPPPGSQSYTVVKGDYLSKIAAKFYGNGNLWPKIYNANKAVIGPNPNLIYPGQVYVIPP